MENYYSKKLTAQQLKEDMIYDKDMIIANLKDKLNSIRERENALETKIFEYEQKNLVSLINQKCLAVYETPIGVNYLINNYII